MEKSNKKRLIIITVYLVILGLIVWFFYSLTKPKATCSDKIKNQNEEGVDCGGVCAPCQKISAIPLKIEESGAVSSGTTDQYDFYGKVVNPNVSIGSSKFHYVMKVKDADGKVLAQREGDSFILPGESKYIIESNIPVTGNPAKGEIDINNVQWSQFKDYYKKPDVKVVNKNYATISSGVGFAEATGLLKNDSPFDFNVVDIKVILRDNDGKIVALNSTQIRTVKSGEQRDFRVFWPNKFPNADSIQVMETQVDINIFGSEAFVDTYYPIQKF